MVDEELKVYRKMASGIKFISGNPVLTIFCRDKFNTRHEIAVAKFKPYFYVPQDEDLSDVEQGAIVSTHNGYRSIFGDLLKKVVTRKISDVKKIGRDYNGYESDVKWDKKCLLDKKITDMFLYDDKVKEIYTLDERFKDMEEDEHFVQDGLVVNNVYKDERQRELVEKGVEYVKGIKDDAIVLKGNRPFEVRTVCFDIEVKMGSDEFNTYDGEVLCVVMYDSYTKRYKSFANDGNERTLIKEVLEEFKFLDPDIITGWNVQFDMEWIINKANEHGLELKNYFSGGDTFVVKYKDHLGKYQKNIYCGGRYVIDAMALYKKKTQTTEKLNSYSLKSVAVVEGFDEWEDFGAKVGEMWKDHKNKVIEYCKLDVQRTWEIIDKKQLIDGVETVAKFFGCNFGETMTNSVIIESMMFLFRGKRILPNIDRRPSDEEYTLKGATVLELKSGMHENVGIFDAASLYPSIIQGFNVSSECLEPSPVSDAHKAKLVKIEHNGQVSYLRKKETQLGLMTQCIQEMRKLREMIRANRQKAIEAGDKAAIQRYTNEEKVAKGVLASTYGVMAFNGFRLYNVACASIITSIARGVIEYILKEFEGSEYKVLYGDTDSVFIQVKDVEDGFKAQDKINKVMRKYVQEFNLDEQVINVNFEKLFKWVIFAKKATPKLKTKLYKRDLGASKKKYIGVISHIESGPREMKEVNELYYRGFELRRSDAALELRSLMSEFFFQLDRHGIDAALKLLKDERKAFLAGKLGIDEISMPRSVNNLERKGPYSDGVKYSKEHLKFRFDKDIMPRLVYVKESGKYPYTKTLCYHKGHVIPDGFVVDYVTMYDKLIRKKFEPIIESLGYHWDTAVLSQDTLSAYL